jgi:hypothetical protein
MLRGQPLEINSPDVTNIVFHDEQVALVVHRDGTQLFQRRFTRLTLGYSKKLANLKYSVVLFIAHYNFCRVHGAHKQTPAMAAELTNHV